MKYKIIIIIILITMPTLALAQQSVNKLTTSNYRQKASEQTAYQNVQLKLTKLQADSILSIHEGYYYQIAMLDSQALDTKERGKQMAVLQANLQQRIKSTLTPLQFEKYQTNMNKFRQRSMQRMDSLINKRKQHLIKN